MYSSAGSVSLIRSSISFALACVTHTGVLLGSVMSIVIAPSSVRGINSAPMKPPALNAPNVSPAKTRIVKNGCRMALRSKKRKSVSKPE
jgi:hypothetical protein